MSATPVNSYEFGAPAGRDKKGQRFAPLPFRDNLICQAQPKISVTGAPLSATVNGRLLGL